MGMGPLDLSTERNDVEEGGWKKGSREFDPNVMLYPILLKQME